MKKRTLLLAITVLVVSAANLFAVKMDYLTGLSDKTKECIECHKSDNPGLYQEWGKSKHYGANVGCYECHQADKSDADAFEHEGSLISVIVSPKDCSKCHVKEVDEFENSHHSKAGRIMGSLDNLLAEVVEGNLGMVTESFPHGVSAAAVNGCWQCHGSVVKVNKDGKLDPATWPNTGIGRVNPDGSEGSCTACHSRHSFSSKLARQPETCGKCHLGPDHPQMEIYNESKHGIAYYANKDRMALGSSKWIVGEDYTAAPTCATCHMSETPDLPITHNIGLRIKWNNRPPVSKLSHETDKKWGLKSASYTSDKRQEDMKSVCNACHNKNIADNFYVQYEGLIDLYNNKYAKPGGKLYKAATKVLKLMKGKSYAKFSQMIDFTWFELWHHEGRRARHAASMLAPDYTHWHGTYDLGKNWYGKYIPELKEVIEQGKKNPASKKAAIELEELLTKITNTPDHEWSIGKENTKVKAARKLQQKKFKNRYK